MTTVEETHAEVERLTVRPQFLFVRGGLSERRKSLVIQARRRRPAEGARPTVGKGFTATKKVGNAGASRLLPASFCRSLGSPAPIMSLSPGWIPLILAGSVCLTIWKAR